MIGSIRTVTTHCKVLSCYNDTEGLNMTYTAQKPACTAVEPKAGCIQSALCILGDKWTPLLIGQLVSGQKTFSELELVLSGISPRTLSARLNMLQKDEIIVKKKYNARPPRYKYQLTDKGFELQDILTCMASWGEKYQS